MKIARNVAVSGWWGEWYGPFPAPSLRELSRPTGVTEGVSPDEWERLTILSFVGAMKIARNVAVSGRLDEWYGPFPAPSLRELSSECETEGVYPDARKRSKITEPVGLSGNCGHGATIGRHSLSQPLRAASSLREGAGNAVVQPGAIHRVARKP